MRLINHLEEKQRRHNKKHDQSTKKCVVCKRFIKDSTLCFAAYGKKSAQATEHKQYKTYSRYLVDNCCVAELKKLNGGKYHETEAQ